jgi:hypothetical protein
MIIDMNLRQRVTTVPSMKSLWRWNIGLAVLHAVQAVAVLALSNGKTFPISTSYLTIDSLQSSVSGSPVLVAGSEHLFELNLAYLVAAFLFLSAAAHLSMATWYRPRYERDLGRGINRLRWFEYALSASVMLVGIAILTGMYDVTSLGLVFVLSAVMNLLGLVMETHNPLRGRTSTVRWTSYIVGCVAGVAPWLAIGGYLLATNIFGRGQFPTFVYAIYVSLFVSFSCFAAVMYLQYKKIGPWKQYLHGERSYMLLSLVAKSLLAWQVFAGALRP